MRSSLILLATIGFVVGVVSTAAGQAPPLSIAVQTGEGTPISWMPAGTSAGGDAYDYDGLKTQEGMWSCDWNITADADPQINSGLIFTNMTGVTQLFSITVGLPTVLAGPTTHGGSFQGGLQDNLIGDGFIAQIATVPASAWYEGQIDGATVLSFYPDPPGTTITAPFDGGAANIPFASGGLPGVTLPSGAVNSTIGIKHTFTLTPNSTATLTGFFIVVPEPATLGLLAVGAMVLVRRRRR
jgi:hypothetical protein